MNPLSHWFQVLLPLLIMAQCPTFALAQRQQTIEAILRAWQQRQERVGTVQATFEGEHIVAKGAYSRRPPPKDVKQDDAGLLPPDDHRSRVSELLLIGTAKYRYETKGADVWLAQERCFVSVNSTVTYDGKTRKHKRETIGRSFRQGGIGVQAHPVELASTVLCPLLMSFRPLHPQMQSFDINEFTPTGAAPVVTGRRCVEFARRNASSQSLVLVCLDPGREYVMTRMRSQVKNVVRTHVEVTYKHDREQGWVPESWHIDNYDQDGSLFGSQDERVTAYVFGADGNDKAFDLEFDPLTYVVDNPAHEQYIIRQDGSKRRIGSGELNKSIDELLATEPKTVEGRRRWTTVLVVLAAVALALSAALLAQRLRRKMRSNEG